MSEDETPENPLTPCRFLRFGISIMYGGIGANFNSKQFEDLYVPLDEHISGNIGKIYEEHWLREAVNEKPSLWRIILKIHGKRFFIINILFSIADTGVRIMRPVFLGFLLAYFSPDQDEITESDAYLYATGLVLATLIGIFMIHPFYVEMMYTSMKIRVGCCSLVYRKILRLNMAESDGLNGRVINLLSNDANRFDMLCMFIIELWRGPIEGILVLYVMYTYIGLASVIGVVFLLCFIPLQGWLSRLIASIRLNTASVTDQRIRVMNEIIRGIQMIKMYAWEYCFAVIVAQIRKREMLLIRKISWVKALIQSFVEMNTRIAIFISILAYVLFGNALTASKVFVLYSLYDMIRLTVVEFFPLALMFVMDASVSAERIREFLLLPEMPKRPNDVNASAIVSLKNVNAFWKNKRDDNGVVLSTPALQNISIEVCSGDFVVIIGQVGAGKTTLFRAIINEMSGAYGSISVNGSISYYNQTPWLFEASVRQNILFGEELDQERYNRVVRCCQLESDLKAFPHGDRTIIGERGISLSGGQRARVALARCIYKKADIYLLDDPLSAVDPRVARSLVDDCIRGFLNKTTVLLITHQIQLIETADKVCVMNNGQMTYQDQFKEFIKSHNVADFTRLDSVDEDDSNDKRLSVKSTDSIQIIEQEAQKAGSVDGSVYSAFIKSGSSSPVLFGMILLFCLGQIAFSMSDIWISEWVNMEEMNADADSYVFFGDSWIKSLEIVVSEFDRNGYIYVYSGFIIIGIVLTISKLILFFNLCTKASINLHDQLFRGCTRATMKFFNENASGRILNRFSKDTGTIDTVLPSTLVDCITFFLQVIGIVVIVCIVNYWLLIPTIVVLILLYLIRTIHISTNRSLKRLEGISRSPAFTHVNATINGLDIIQSYGKQSVLIDEYDLHQDLHTSTWFLIINTNRAFAFWMDIVCWIYIALVTYSFLFFDLESVFGGRVGLAITQVMSLVGMTQYGLRQTAELENQMTSVERVIEYVNLKSEPDLETNVKKFKVEYPYVDIDGWPSKGNIELTDVTLEYDVGVPALSGVTFNVKDGEKIGIVGRTGAGKSSIISAIFRLAETRGSILIDGIDITDIGLHKLRSSMSIIPQEPMLFSGSLRDNLDPWKEYKDDELWDALDEVDLKYHVSDTDEGLYAPVSDGGGNYSIGQKQLICLARAILKKSNIIFLDEATASVDSETDRQIQSTIQRKFFDKTILTIAHRLNTIIDSDKVLVMDEGRIAEFGHPHDLISQSGIFYDMLQQTGQFSFDELSKIAQQNYAKIKSKDL